MPPAAGPGEPCRMTHIGPNVVPVAAKLPSTLAASLDELAGSNELTRSAVIRELIEAAVDERIAFPSREDRAERDARVASARMRDHAQRQREYTDGSRKARKRFGLAEMLQISVEARLGPRLRS